MWAAVQEVSKAAANTGELHDLNVNTLASVCPLCCHPGAPIIPPIRRRTADVTKQLCTDKETLQYPQPAMAGGQGKQSGSEIHQLPNIAIDLALTIM